MYAYEEDIEQWIDCIRSGCVDTDIWIFVNIGYVLYVCLFWLSFFPSAGGELK